MKYGTEQNVCIYDPQVLVDIANNWIYEENEQHLFWRKHRPNPGALLDLNTESDRIDYHTHYERASATWYSFAYACKLVHANPETVLATVKAINRYEKRKKWQVCVHLPGNEYDNIHNPAKNRLRHFWNAA